MQRKKDKSKAAAGTSTPEKLQNSNEKNEKKLWKVAMRKSRFSRKEF